MRKCLPPTTCRMSFVKFFFGQRAEAYQWRVCYQRGLPRLFFFKEGYHQNIYIFDDLKENCIVFVSLMNSMLKSGIVKLPF